MKKSLIFPLLILVLSSFSCEENASDYESTTTSEKDSTTPYAILTFAPQGEPDKEHINYVIVKELPALRQIQALFESPKEFNTPSCISGNHLSVQLMRGEAELLNATVSLDPECALLRYTQNDRVASHKLSYEDLLFLKDFQVKDKLWKRFYWMEGSWRIKEGQGASYESWKIGPAGLNGEMHSVNDAGKQTFQEKLSIKKVGKDIFYYADVKYNEQPIGFKMVSYSPGQVVFENREHDAPQRITYTRKNDSTLVARVEAGLNKNPPQPFGRDYVMQRMPLSTE